MLSPNECRMDSSGEAVSARTEAVTEQVQELGKSIGRTIGCAAQTAQNTFRQTKKMTTGALGVVMDGIDTSADYLTDRGMEGVVKDTETLIRRHPYQAVMIALSMGYFISRSRRV